MHALLRLRRWRRLQVIIVFAAMFMIIVLSCLGELSLIGQAQYTDTKEASLGRWTCGLYMFGLYVIVLARVCGALRVKYRSLWLFGLCVFFVSGVFLFSLKLFFNAMAASSPTFIGIDVLAWSHFWSGFSAVFPTVGFVMLVTPVLLPNSSSSSLMRSLSKKNTGVSWLDRYLALDDSRQKDEDVQVDVILVEDDLRCASLVLRFLKNCGLSCHHVESLSEGMRVFERKKFYIRLLILDNFVRLDDAVPSGVKTGAQWAKLLNEKYPRCQRRFKVALITGHSHLLDEYTDEADIVLQKPWEPRRFFDFLKREGVV